MDKHFVVYPYHGMLFGNAKERVSNTFYTQHIMLIEISPKNPHILYNLIYIKYTGEANVQRHKVDEPLSRAGGNEGKGVWKVTVIEYKVSFQNNESV